MDIYVLGSKYEVLSIMDVYNSLIWADRYNTAGDFELYTSLAGAIPEGIAIGNYISTKDSKRFMIIESLEISSSIDEGPTLKTTGRSLESILMRRVVAKYTSISGSIQNGIQKILNENVINPSLEDRKIPGFTFKKSDDPVVVAAEIDTYFLGETVYDAIVTMCQYADLGFHVLPDGEGGFVFELYSGVDYSYAQEERPWVVFSPEYNNLLSSNYYTSPMNMKTVGLVGGPGEDWERPLAWTTGPYKAGSGLDRRETFIEATGIATEYENPNTGERVPYSKAQIERFLQNDGRIAMYDYLNAEAFEGEADVSQQFHYGTDFDLGDIVQVENEFGLQQSCRVTEIVISDDSGGYIITPTFVGVEN